MAAILETSIPQPAKEETHEDDLPNGGTLVLDATCYPADIAYPQDVNLLINTDSFFTKQLPERLSQLRALYSSEYTLSKYQFYEWRRMRAIEGRISFINLQIENMYSPEDGEERFLTFLVRSMRNRVEKLDLTDGIQIRDFIYVDNVV